MPVFFLILPATFLDLLPVTLPVSSFTFPLTSCLALSLLYFGLRLESTLVISALTFFTVPLPSCLEMILSVTHLSCQLEIEPKLRYTPDHEQAVKSANLDPKSIQPATRADGTCPALVDTSGLCFEHRRKCDE